MLGGDLGALLWGTGRRGDPLPADGTVDLNVPKAAGRGVLGAQDPHSRMELSSPRSAVPKACLVVQSPASLLNLGGTAPPQCPPHFISRSLPI